MCNTRPFSGAQFVALLVCVLMFAESRLICAQENGGSTAARLELLEAQIRDLKQLAVRKEKDSAELDERAAEMQLQSESLKAEVEAMKAALVEQLTALNTAPEVQSASLRDPRVQYLQNQLVAVTLQLQQYQDSQRRNTPAVSRLRKQQSALKQQLEQYLESLNQYASGLQASLADRLAKESPDGKSMFPAIRKQMATLNERRAELQAQLAKVLAESSKLQEKPLPEDAVFKVFNLQYSDGNDAAEMIEKILAGQQYRLAVDDRANALIIRGEKSLLEPVQALLTYIDRPTAADKKPGGVNETLRRTYQIHVYWLAAKQPDDSLQSPDSVLPQTVIQALDRVGISSPGLVSAVTSSFALADDGEAVVTTVSRAMIGGLPATLNFQGRISLTADQAVVESALDVQGAFQSEISGSIAAPLGNYVVLGTADSLGGEQNDQGRGRRGFGGRGGLSSFGGRGGLSNPSENDPPSPARFGFVIQVVEAESFARDSAGPTN